MASSSSAAVENLVKDLKRFIYSKEVAPNNIIWLILGLPVQDEVEKHLKLQIAETILFGFGNSGIHLKTNSEGYITWNHSSLDECLWYEHHNNFLSNVLAYEKETCLKLCPPQGEIVRDWYTFEGNISVSLNKSNYDKCMSQIYKELAVVQRQFRVQYHVPIKHQKYHRFAFKRIFYQLHGKCSILSVRSTDPIVGDEMPPQDTYEKPWLQTKKSEPKLTRKPSSNQELNSKLETVRSNTPTLRQQSSERSLKPSSSSPGHSSGHGPGPSSPSLTASPGDALASSHPPHPSNPSSDAIKRVLKPLIPHNSVCQDIPLSSTPTLLDLTTRVAHHLGAIFKRQVTHLTLDFVKNSTGDYVLIDILGFQFNGYGPDVERGNGTLGRVLSLSPDLQYKIEHFYRCRLNGTKFHGHRHRPHHQQIERSNGVGTQRRDFQVNDGNTSSDDEDNNDDDDDSTLSSGPKPSPADLHSNTITPQTLTCRMCTRKITPGSIRYLLTSVMLHSTVVHLRSRLPLEDLPPFCRNRSVTMKSMQRIDDISSLSVLKHVDVTESDLVTCEECYALYREESKLMEVEHKLAKFTRIAGNNSTKFDLRKKISKPFNQSPGTANATPIPAKDAQTSAKVTTTLPQPQFVKRLSVSGGNIMTRPLSAPMATRSSTLSLPSKSPTNTPLPNARPTLRPSFSRTSTLTSIQSDQSFLAFQTTPIPKSRSEKESHLRDTFRAKNSPTRTLSKDFYQAVSPLKRTQSMQSEFDRKEKTPETQQHLAHSLNRNKITATLKENKNEKEYPLVSSIPIGRQVTRADVMSQPFTLGRMMIALHKVTDLPVIFLDAYEDFRVSYVVLGRRREAPCMKNFTFTRNRANRFKNRYLTRTTTNIGRILEGDEESSDSNTSSSHATSLCSDPSSGYSEDEEENEAEGDEEGEGEGKEGQGQMKKQGGKKKKKEEDEEGEEGEESDGSGNDDNAEEDLYPITRRTSQLIMKENEMKKLASADSDDPEDEADQEEPEDEPEICVGALDVKYMRMSYFLIPGDAREEANVNFNNFVNKTGRILVVLCAKLKHNAVIDERHWNLPDETKSAKAKAHKLRKEIHTIRREYQLKSSQSFADLSVSESLRYDPREDQNKTTDVGDPLPPDAIGYAYISISQLKCSAVKRLDVGAPLTYAIKHLPKERSVPMLRAMVGIDRPVYPMDNWSLPYSLVELQQEKNLYVAEFEDQFTTTTPLPPEWLNVELERNQNKRVAQTAPHPTGEIQPFGEINFAEKLNSLVRAQVSADVDGHKRAPTLYVSAGRVERMTLATQLQPIVKLEITVDSEHKMERMDSSVWCLCIQVLQARHLAQKNDIFAQNRPIWICSYDFFGESVCVKGEILSDDFDEGVIYFGTTSKHLFKGSIDAVEAMFQNNPPLQFEMERVQTGTSGPRDSFVLGTTMAAKSLLLEIPIEAISLHELKKLNLMKTNEEKRLMVGSLGLDITEERFVDMTVQLHPAAATAATTVTTASSSFSTPSVTAAATAGAATASETTAASLYPPYLNINVKFFRMGPHEDTINPNEWLPPQTKIGQTISKCVTRILPIEFGSKTSAVSARIV